MEEETWDLLVVGGGPAGLRAAEVAAAAGRRTVIADRMPSVGRKLLVAGRGGLNLTHSEPVESFVTRYNDDGRWNPLLADFSPGDLRAWVHELGVETFVGTSGRVFPATKQAAPLLRRWLRRLKEKGIAFRLRHEWTGLQCSPDGAWKLEFRNPDGVSNLRARTVVLALGGGSWPTTGSTGTWTEILRPAGIAITPLTAANCGYEVNWSSAFLELSEGKPLKNIRVRAGAIEVAGELLITRYGLEGGALYQLGRALRQMPSPRLEIDLKPSFTPEQLRQKISSRGPSFDCAALARAWNLSSVATALLHENSSHASAETLAARVKAYPIPLIKARPIEEAISSAGGVAWSELDADLMLSRLPGIFCAGEMIDWEAPTGGYLLQGCFSTATRAAQGAIRFLNTGFPAGLRSPSEG